MRREPLLPNPSRTIYINRFYDPRIRLALYSIILIMTCVAIVIFGFAIKITLDYRATQTAFAVSTIKQAQTLTAIPTATRTPTPTLTPTPTNTPTPTATPEISWLRSIVESGSNRPGYFLSM